MPESRGNAHGPSEGSGHEPSTASGDAPRAAIGGRPDMLMRVSVPAEGGLREIASEVGTKIAEAMGGRAGGAQSIAAGIEGLAGKVAPPGSGVGDITFEFHAVSGELVVHARCGGRSSELRHRLHA